MHPLLIVCFFTAVIHLTETLALSMRLSGVRTRQVATALSFLTSALLISRMSNMLQAPFLGGMVDTAILLGDPDSLGWQFRQVIFWAFLGGLVGALLVPTFVSLFSKGILLFESVGSIPQLLWQVVRRPNLPEFFACFRLPRLPAFSELSLARIPKLFLLLNVFIGSLYAIGVLVSLYAGAQIPEYRTTASQLSGIVNGIATVLLAVMVDPTGALITDQAVQGKRPERDVRTVVFYLVTGRVLGTLILSQLLFLPCTEYIKTVTLWIRAVAFHL